MRASSYQSPIASSKPSRVLFLALACLVAAARPYEDTRHRFSLRLPEGWRLAPRFGDLYGMSFERSLPEQGGRVASLTVHADPIPASSLPEFADRVESEWGGSGSTRVSEKKGQVGKQPALIRELEVNDARGARRARSYFFEANGRFFHVRLEAPLASLRALDREVDGVLSSFRPGAAAAAAAPRAADPRFLGRWVGAGGVVLALDGDGGFVLGNRAGTFTLQGATLRLQVPGKAAIAFEVELGGGGQALTLRSPSLPEPAVYRRASEKAPSEPGAPADRLDGRWAAQGPQGELLLVLARDGAFRLGPLIGRWEASDGRLTLRGARGESVIYRFELTDRGLTLTGGDLEAPLLFRRSADE